jgi:hypothetical protein
VNARRKRQNVNARRKRQNWPEARYHFIECVQLRALSLLSGCKQR